MKVAVVTLNDFPDAVFSTLELANEYKRRQPKYNCETGAHLYYSVYLYEVQDTVEATASSYIMDAADREMYGR